LYDFYFVINIKDQNFILNFGLHLKKIRIAKKLSQESLAYASDVPISQIGRIERGEINTTICTAKVLADALGISIKELFEF